MKTVRLYLAALLALLTLCPADGMAQGMRTQADDAEYVQIFLGESFKLDVKEVSNIVISDPEIVEVIPVTDSVLVLNAKKPGTTVLTLFEATGERTIRVLVAQNDLALALRIKSAIGYPDVMVLVAESKIVLEGEVEDQDERNRAITIASAFLPKEAGGAEGNNVYNTTEYPSGDDNSEGDVADAQSYSVPTPEGIIDFLKIRNQKQVRVRVQVVRINQNARKDFGLSFQESVSYGVGYNEFIFGPSINQGSPLDGSGRQGNIGARDFLGQQIRSLGHGAIGNGSGSIDGDTEDGEGTADIAYNATLHTLERRGDAKTLARPVITTLDGAEASFLAGGKAILSTSSSSGGILETTTQTEEFGVKVFFRPKIRSNGNIGLFITPKVTELPTPFGAGSFLIESRNVRSNVELPSNSTMALAGLFELNTNLQIEKMPWLGTIPILGELFTRRNNDGLERELVFLVTPQIVGSPLAATTGPEYSTELGEMKSFMNKNRVFQSLNPDIPAKGPRLAPRELEEQSSEPLPAQLEPRADATPAPARREFTQARAEVTPVSVVDTTPPAAPVESSAPSVDSGSGATELALPKPLAPKLQPR